MLLKNKVAFVTAAGSGIGAAGAHAMAREGAYVVVTDRDVEAAKSVADSIQANGFSAEAFQLDVTDDQALTSAIGKVTTQKGRLDILHSHAGLQVEGKLENVSVNDMDASWALNVRAHFVASQAAIAPMRAQGGGSVIITSSNSGVQYDREMIAYATTKHAVLAMTRQMAADYAKERNQGVAAGGSPTGSESDPIIVHGDVRRMLLTIRAMTEAGRALSVFTGQQLDLAKYAQDEVKAKAARYVGLLTPVAKAFLTDRGLDATIMAQQVFGGHGYIRETGIEQLVRDTRIAQIYEGTNGIQAIDFLGRKVTGDNLAALNEFVADLKAQMRAFTHVDAVKVAAVCARLDALVIVAESINEHKVAQPALINACAVDFLDAFGYTLYGFYWLAMVDKVADHEDKVFAEQKAYLAKFYFDKLLPKADYHIAQVRAGDATTMAMPAEFF